MYVYISLQRSHAYAHCEAHRNKTSFMERQMQMRWHGPTWFVHVSISGSTISEWYNAGSTTPTTYFTERGYMAYVTWRTCSTRNLHAHKHSRSHEHDHMLHRTGLLTEAQVRGSIGRNVLLHGNSWRLRYDGLWLRFWLQNELVRYAHSCFFLTKPQLECIKS